MKIQSHAVAAFALSAVASHVSPYILDAVAQSAPWEIFKAVFWLTFFLGLGAAWPDLPLAVQEYGWAKQAKFKEKEPFWYENEPGFENSFGYHAKCFSHSILMTGLLIAVFWIWSGDWGEYLVSLFLIGFASHILMDIPTHTHHAFEASDQGLFWPVGQIAQKLGKKKLPKFSHWLRRKSAKTGIIVPGARLRLWPLELLDYRHGTDDYETGYRQRYVNLTTKPWELAFCVIGIAVTILVTLLWLVRIR
ncbi:MAG: metal-dependent hydrolase [bacterium]|nr:metal-dependent hydrolase [bacterium]